MRFRRAFFISPAYDSTHYGNLPACPPIGLGYVAEYAATKGIDYTFFDMNLSSSVDNIFESIEKYRPDIIGISLMTFKYEHSYSFIRSIKEKFYNIPICAGGPHCSSYREKVLIECNSIDYIVVLDGEETFYELCSNKPLEHIKGLIYFSDDKINYHGDRPLHKEIDIYPFPKFKNFNVDNYRQIGLSTSRGCPYKCIFCESSALLGKIYRSRSAQNVINEFRYWYIKGIRKFSLHEDNFAVDKKRVIAICNGIVADEISDITIEGNNIRADNLTCEILGKMYAAGFRSVCLGVESGSDAVLRVIKKGETVSQIEGAIKTAVLIGFEVKLYFIVGHPEETWGDFKKSVNLALKYPVHSAKFYSAMPVPGTELYEMVKENGIFLEDPQFFLSDRNPFYNRPFFDYKTGMSIDEKKKALAMVPRILHKIEFRYRFRKCGVLLSSMIAHFFFFPFIYPIWSRNGILRKMIGRV